MKETLIEWLGAVAFTVLVVITVLLWQAEGQQAPTQPQGKTGQLTELEQAKLLSSYKSAVLASMDEQQAIQRRQKAVDAFTQLQRDIRAAHKWPDDAQFNIQVEQDHATVVVPPSPAAADSKQQKNEKEKH